MVKQRMTSVDVAAEVACLKQRLVGLRMANIYDINPKTYLLKMSKSGMDGDKVFLLLESGSRFHTTEVMREKSDIPSNFTLKLRKHIRTRRLEDIRQLGVDRIVDFVFGSGEAMYHLILEMYSQGNIILTDSKYEILTLLRSHRDDDKGLAIMARHPYPMHAVRLRQALQLQELQSAFATAEVGAALKSVLANVLPYGPAIAEHCLLDAWLQPNQKVLQPGGVPAEQLAMLHAAVGRLEAWLAGLDSEAPRGFITVAPAGGKGKKQQAKVAADSMPANGDQNIAAGNGLPADSGVLGVYQDFNPLQLNQSKEQQNVEFPTFDAALDEFYSKIEGQRAEVAKVEAEKQALSKLDRIRSDQAARAQALMREADESELKASLIQYNLEAVDAAIAAVNAALATGVDWQDLERMIKEERRAGNPVAGLIHSLQLEQNRATLLLSNFLDEQDEGDDEALTRPASKVVVDLGLSAHSNATVYYEARKKHVAKQQKTLAANEQALRMAEKKALMQLQQVRSMPTVAPVRKPAWFERFHWFISSENYLIISGRDAQQNEQIVKRYFVKGDAYVHADLHGASSTIVKNVDPSKPIPPLTLLQAGTACVCRSRAWDAKIVTSAWWVHHHQVSQTAPSGEYLPTGSFMIRGKKNYLPPQPLVFGFGYMFKLEASCIPNHLGERAVRAGMEGDAASTVMDTEDTQDIEDVDLSELGINDDDGDENEGAVSTSGHSAALGRAGSHMTSTNLGAAASSQVSALDQFLEGSLDVLAAGSSTHSTGQYERYGLRLEDGSTAVQGFEAEGSHTQQQQQPGRRHLSAKERELAKKAGMMPGTAPISKPAKDSTAAAAATAATTNNHQGAAQKQGKQHQQSSSGMPTQQQQQQAKAASQRGKNKKEQKVKEKYADQDEEDRALALQLLASQGEKKTRSDRRKERKEKKEQKRKAALQDVAGTDAAAMEEAIAKATGKQWLQQPQPGTEEPSSPSEASGSETESEDHYHHLQQQQQPVAALEHAVAVGNGAAGWVQPDTAAAAAAGSSQHVTPPSTEQHGDDESTVEAAMEGAVDDAERAEVAALLAEEKVPELAEEERDKLTVLDTFTGIPRADDILLSAVPVCGPYSAMQNFKYRVKLTPGPAKKGKAARQVMELLIRGLETAQREKDLIKAIPEMESINAMVGTVKISMPGLQKLKMNEKKSKKAESKKKAAAAAFKQ